MTSKRYRLLRDLPNIPFGTMFTEEGSVEGENPKGYYVPSNFLSDMDWFEEVRGKDLVCTTTCSCENENVFQHIKRV